MDIRILKEIEYSDLSDSLLEMLTAADNEFVPPLSSRSSTVQKNLSDKTACANGVSEYFNCLKSQKLLAAFEGGKLLGFVSFIENYVCDVIKAEQQPNIYISTLIVSENARGRGLTYKMYEKLFEEYKAFSVFTRTWSTNFAHIKILSKFGFELYATLKNDRGAGIDTVYYKRIGEIK